MHKAGTAATTKPLSYQVAAAVQQVYKCLPGKNETWPCINRLFSGQNQTFHSSSTETLGFLTCANHIKGQILVRL